jgi:hypothetical protein
MVRRLAVVPVAAILALAAGPRALTGGEQARPLDELAPAAPAAPDASRAGAVTGWEPAPAEGVRLDLLPANGPGGAGLRLEFDFQGHGGYAIARRRLALDLPENYEFAFWVRGESPRNNLEFKLLDESGDNVWWSVRRDFTFPRDWQRIAIKKRQLSFAWGPAGGGDVRRLSALEIVVSAGEGGRGAVEVSGLTFEPLPAPHPYARQPQASASSAAAGGEPARALDGDARTGWHSLPAAGEEQWLAIDFGERRELGGLAIDWDAEDFATRFAVLVSRDGATWETARTVERTVAAPGPKPGEPSPAARIKAREPSPAARITSYLYLPDTDARAVRLSLLASSRGRGYGVREVTVEPVEISASPNAFFAAVARDAPRGAYPRAMSGEQAYWTLVGVDAGRDQALLNEDGLLEAGKAGFSIEPFVSTGGALVGWSDVRSTPSLAERSLPIPSVVWSARGGKAKRAAGVEQADGAETESRQGGVWRRSGLSLEVTAFASGAPESPVVYARYRLRNRGPRRQQSRLFLAIRPFQVNPPWQFLGRPGGVVEVRRIALDGRAVTVDGERTRQAVVALSQPAAFGAMSFDDGSIVDLLRQGRVPAAAAVSDPFGYASAALAYDFRLAPGATGEIDLALPLGPRPDARFPARAAGIEGDLQAEAGIGGEAQPRAGIGEQPARSRVARELRQVLAGWRARLGGVAVTLPAAAQPLADTLRTALAHILISREGPALRPGTRSYARSWIRDGALMSDALLRLGHAAEVREFAAWYVGYQGAGGKVPCCVDARGADPVPENDSAGELLYLVASYYRFTGDRLFLAANWQHVERAVDYLDALRQQRRTAAYRESGKLAFFGLLPESISHEGYSAHPEHSYWDDFFALRGLVDAADMARALGKEDRAAAYAAMRDEFRQDLYASLRRTIAGRGLDYIPASVELGDFDPTSTTIAVAPAGELANLPAAELRRTFERYFEEVEKRQASRRSPGGRPADQRGAPPTAYTPYELRAVGTFVRLGWRERAQQLLAGFMADRRPPAWNQWPEVIWQPPRHAGFLGDLPHAWVAAEFIRSFLDLLVYERDADHALVIAAGVPAAWATSGSGMSVRGLATPYGKLGYDLSAPGGEARLRLWGDLRMPPGGLVVRWPFSGGAATVNGRRVELAAGAELVVRELPAEVRLPLTHP